MFCGISGETPQEPVLNTKSGHVYERRLAEKVVTDTGKDPVTGVDTTVDDLVAVKTALPHTRPRPPTATSVPSLLHLLQSEWDSLMVETHSLKTQHAQLRKELSAALYENDAARRVIARLVKERDDARKALATVKATFQAAGVSAQPADAGAGAGSDAMDVDDGGLSQDIIDKMTETSTGLSKTRRKRKPPVSVTPSDSLSSYKLLPSLPAPKGTASPATSLDVLLSDSLSVTTHASGLVAVHDLSSRKLVGHSAGAHAGGATTAAWNAAMKEQGGPASFITGGKDGAVRIWEAEVETSGVAGKFAIKDVLGAGVAVGGVTVHASGAYWVAAGGKGWAFGDYGAGRVVRKVRAETDLTSSLFHPDGLILATPTPSSVLLWDVKSSSIAATFDSPTLGAHGSLAFSENGYHLATLGSDATVRVWDLRKLAVGKEVKIAGVGSNGIVAYDYSGQYAAVAGGGEVRVYATKGWDVLATYRPSSGSDFAGVGFGTDAKYVVAVGTDGVVKVWAGDD
ncbi:Prp19-domain-containing protein [Gonapodya prolifera JEL478]|uniref:Pre-mRNA-processing factor 19 n=1 Tax=Gonapodya prolifera (strain JEL478) TaxID=1344416 RepID=A0A139ABD5_GONPJ|nr:Prp19-domain-containing protein [Gonapodya prolifera JEL478]|eukprot:KXS14070.1 Prp19-domain-containing protein [Gonapodya prolifera JEL478]